MNTSLAITRGDKTEGGPGGGILAWVRRHQLSTFFALAFVLSQWPVLIAPHSLVPLGPFLAAMIMLPIAGGRRALSSFWHAATRWRAGLRWYAIALGLPLVITMAAYGITLLLGAEIDPARHGRTPGEVVPVFLQYVIMVGIGEELAWRGFALPRLMPGRSIFGAALLLGAVHVLWHWPIAGGELAYADVVPEAIGIMSFSIFTAWLYTHTRGGLLMPLLAHVSVNTTAWFVFVRFDGGDKTLLFSLWAIGWLAVATAITIWGGVRKPASPELTYPAIESSAA